MKGLESFKELKLKEKKFSRCVGRGSFGSFDIRCEYDSFGHVIRYCSGAADDRYDYDVEGNIVHCKDSDGYEEWHEYDADGNRIHSKNSNGFEEWMKYDSFGNKIYSRNSSGDESWRKLDYDTAGRVIYSEWSSNSEWFSLGSSKVWQEYDAAGNMIHYRSSGGSEEWYEYDVAGNMIHYKDSDGHENWREYDDAGNMIRWKNSFIDESYYYDDSGNKICWKDSSGRMGFYEYDAAGNEIWYKDSRGEERWSEYDSAGNMIHYRNSDGSEEWYEYDGYYRAIGQEVPEKVNFLALRKAKYYSNAAKKETVDFVKARYEEKAAYWGKISRHEPVTSKEESRCGLGHRWDFVDSYVHDRFCLEKASNPEDVSKYKSRLESLEKEIRYFAWDKLECENKVSREQESDGMEW